MPTGIVYHGDRPRSLRRSSARSTALVLSAIACRYAPAAATWSPACLSSSACAACRMRRAVGHRTGPSDGSGQGRAGFPPLAGTVAVTALPWAAIEGNLSGHTDVFYVEMP